MTQPAAAVAGPARTENLALIFQEVLTSVVRLRSNRQELSDADSFRFYMKEGIKAGIQEARNQAGYTPEDIKMATLALVGFLDESVLDTKNPIFAAWPRKPLQEELFGIHMAGEVFFQNLEQLLGRRDSTDLADLLEVHYLCLLLGYGGRYSVGGKVELHAIMTATRDRIRRIRGASADPFLNFEMEPEKTVEGRDPWLKGFLGGAIACAVLMILLLVAFSFVLSSGASEVAAMALQAKG
jgi:type VI secretion system protein ImpK